MNSDVDVLVPKTLESENGLFRRLLSVRAAWSATCVLLHAVRVPLIVLVVHHETHT